MAIINPADLTFNGKEIRELSEAIFESVFEKPDVQMFHTIVEGIKAKQQIALLGRVSGLTGKGSGGCNPTAVTNTIGMSEKFWNPETVSNRFEECWDSLKETFFIWSTQNGIAKSDITKTDFFIFLQERVSDALIEEIFRIAWFSDTAADTVANGGVLTNGTDTGYFTKIDGLWKQIFAIVAADANRKTAGIDSRNGQASYAAQEFTDTDTTNNVVTKTLQNMRYGADFRLRGKENLIYVTTQSVADQYERELTERNAAFTTERLENGIMQLKSGSITVFGFQFWDIIIREFYDDGAKYYLPHRALLFPVTNIQVGTEEAGTLSEMDVFYDKKSKQNILDTQYDLDAKVIEDYLIQAAY